LAIVNALAAPVRRREQDPGAPSHRSICRPGCERQGPRRAILRPCPWRCQSARPAAQAERNHEAQDGRRPGARRRRGQRREEAQTSHQVQARQDDGETGQSAARTSGQAQQTRSDPCGHGVRQGGSSPRGTESHAPWQRKPLSHCGEVGALASGLHGGFGGPPTAWWLLCRAVAVGVATTDPPNPFSPISKARRQCSFCCFPCCILCSEGTYDKTPDPSRVGF